MEEGIEAHLEMNVIFNRTTTFNSFMASPGFSLRRSRVLFIADRYTATHKALPYISLNMILLGVAHASMGLV